jgi:hypothetical protein
MPDYRLYCLDRLGHFTQFHDIDADHDAEALTIARTMQLTSKCELWERGRLVAELAAYEAPSSEG